MSLVKIYIFVLISAVMVGCNITGASNKPVVGSGSIVSENRKVAPFVGVVTNGNYDIDVVYGEDQSLEIKSDDNVIPLIVANVKDEILYIKDHRAYSTGKRPHIKIAASNLDKLSIVGADKVQVSKVKNDRLDLDINGNGSVYMEGEARAFNIDLSGAVYINAKDLKSERASVKVTGTGKADVFVTEELLANINGTGIINYYGNTKVVNKSVSGTGTVMKK
jgi:hypothetical protein